MNDEELIARACEVGAALLRRPGDLDRLAGGLLAELAGRLAARPAPCDGPVPDEDPAAACPDHRPVLDSAAGWYCPTCGSDSPPASL